MKSGYKENVSCALRDLWAAHLDLEDRVSFAEDAANADSDAGHERLDKWQTRRDVVADAIGLLEDME